jgi:hypothetical protein
MMQYSQYAKDEQPNRLQQIIIGGIIVVVIGLVAVSIFSQQQTENTKREAIAAFNSGDCATSQSKFESITQESDIRKTVLKLCGLQASGNTDVQEGNYSQAFATYGEIVVTTDVYKPLDPAALRQTTFSSMINLLATPTSADTLTEPQACVATLNTLNRAYEIVKNTDESHLDTILDLYNTCAITSLPNNPQTALDLYRQALSLITADSPQYNEFISTIVTQGQAQLEGESPDITHYETALSAFLLARGAFTDETNIASLTQKITQTIVDYHTQHPDAPSVLPLLAEANLDKAVYLQFAQQLHEAQLNTAYMPYLENAISQTTLEALSDDERKLTATLYVDHAKFEIEQPDFGTESQWQALLTQMKWVIDNSPDETLVATANDLLMSIGFAIDNQHGELNVFYYFDALRTQIPTLKMGESDSFMLLLYALQALEAKTDGKIKTNADYDAVLNALTWLKSGYPSDDESVENVDTTIVSITYDRAIRYAEGNLTVADEAVAMIMPIETISGEAYNQQLRTLLNSNNDLQAELDELIANGDDYCNEVEAIYVQQMTDILATSTAIVQVTAQAQGAAEARATAKLPPTPTLKPPTDATPMPSQVTMQTRINELVADCRENQLSDAYENFGGHHWHFQRSSNSIKIWRMAQKICNVLPNTKHPFASWRTS